MSGLILGMIGGGISGLSTTLGALPILSRNQRMTKILKNINMDFIIGVMLSASAFSLIIPAFERGHQYSLIAFALIVGALFIKLVGIFLEKLTLKFDSLKNNKQAVLYIIAMMAHNFPEGIASGASLTIHNSHQSYSLLGAIAIQNIPEGLTTALSFLSLGLNPAWAFFGNFLTGLVEFVGGMIGGYLSSSIDGILPVLMAFAGGAMMSLTMMEMLNRIKETSLSFFIRPGFLAGSVLMMTLARL